MSPLVPVVSAAPPALPPRVEEVSVAEAADAAREQVGEGLQENNALRRAHEANLKALEAMEARYEEQLRQITVLQANIAAEIASREATKTRNAEGAKADDATAQALGNEKTAKDQLILTLTQEVEKLRKEWDFLDKLSRGQGACTML